MARPGSGATLPVTTFGIAEAQRVLHAQPFSVLVGATLTAFGQERTELRVPLKPELLQQFGFAHGGVIAYCVDNALTFAGGTVLGDSIVTRGMSIDYVRPARGLELIARAHVVSYSGRQASCRCDVFSRTEDGTESLCAVGQGTISRIEVSRR